MASTSAKAKAHSVEEIPLSWQLPGLVGRRMPSSSLSSLSLSLSYPTNDDFPPFTSPTPVQKFKGMPFSWERIPGIPKHQNSRKPEYSSARNLPLPPAGIANSSVKKIKFGGLHCDPFSTALVACSKDDKNMSLWRGNNNFKIMRRFGFLSMYASCKRTCAVSKSVVLLHRHPD